MQKLRVFISSTMEDLEKERWALAKEINNNQFWEAAYAESFIARSESPREVCLEEVRKSHIYIGIFKNRYGYVPKKDNPRGLSVVNLEYEEAKVNKLPTLVFICKDATNREPRLEQFLQEITDFDEGHWKKDYSSIKELISFGMDALKREVTKRSVESIEAERRKEVEDIYNLPYFKRLKGSF